MMPETEGQTARAPWWSPWAVTPTFSPSGAVRAPLTLREQMFPFCLFPACPQDVCHGVLESCIDLLCSLQEPSGKEAAEDAAMARGGTSIQAAAQGATVVSPLVFNCPLRSSASFCLKTAAKRVAWREADEAASGIRTLNLWNFFLFF